MEIYDMDMPAVNFNENRGRVFLKIIFYEHVVAIVLIVVLIPTFYGALWATLIHLPFVVMTFMGMLLITAYGSKPKYYDVFKWVIALELVSFFIAIVGFGKLG